VPCPDVTRHSLARRPSTSCGTHPGLTASNFIHRTRLPRIEHRFPDGKRGVSTTTDRGVAGHSLLLSVSLSLRCTYRSAASTPSVRSFASRILRSLASFVRLARFARAKLLLRMSDTAQCVRSSKNQQNSYYDNTLPSVVSCPHPNATTLSVQPVWSSYDSIHSCTNCPTNFVRSRCIFHCSHQARPPAGQALPMSESVLRR